MDRLRFSSLERLENRVAPAVLLNPRTVTYVDPDGDAVRVTTSKGTWDLEEDFVFAPSGQGEQLQRIDLANKTEFAGAKITVSATGLGDELAHVGHVDARNIDLAAVTIDGDLGRIEVGDTIARTAGLGILDVQSMGRFGIDTQVPGTDPELGRRSGVIGALGKWTVAGDFDSVTLGADIIRSARIRGDVIGSDFSSSGSVFAEKNIDSMVIGGDLVGGEANFTGRVESFNGRIGSIQINGAVLGGDGDNTGRIVGQSIGTVRIGDDLRGGVGILSGSIEAFSAIRSVQIDGDMIGGSGINSAGIATEGSLGAVRIGGGIQGGTGPGSAFIGADTIGSLQTGLTGDGDVLGGSGNRSARISGGEIGKVTIDGDLTGGAGSSSGIIEVFEGSLDSLLITGSLIGGDQAGSDDLSQSGFVLAQDFGTVTIRGDIVAGEVLGTGTIVDSGAIRSNHAIRSLTVGGSIIGNDENPVVVSAVGSPQPKTTTDVAIGSIRVGGRMSDANILAGYDADGIPVNADAQINSITVEGNVLSSNLVAGAVPGNDGFFGTADDAPISGANDQDSVVSRISRIVVAGAVNGSVGGGDAFGFVAQQIGSLRIGGNAVALTPGPSNDLTPIPIAATTGDVFVREV